MQIHQSPVAPNPHQFPQHPIKKLPHSNFIRHESVEIPQTYRAMGRIIFPCIST